MKLKELLNKLILPLKGGGIIKLKPYANIVKNIDVQVDGGGDTPEPQPEPEPIDITEDLQIFNVDWTPTTSDNNVSKPFSILRLLDISSNLMFTDDDYEHFKNYTGFSVGTNLLYRINVKNTVVYSFFGFSNNEDIKQWIRQFATKYNLTHYMKVGRTGEGYKNTTNKFKVIVSGPNMFGNIEQVFKGIKLEILTVGNKIITIDIGPIRISFLNNEDIEIRTEYETYYRTLIK